MCENTNVAKVSAPSHSSIIYCVTSDNDPNCYIRPDKRTNPKKPCFLPQSPSLPLSKFLHHAYPLYFPLPLPAP